MALRKNFFGPDSSSSNEEAAMAVLFLHELTMAGKRKHLWMCSWLKRRETKSVYRTLLADIMFGGETEGEKQEEEN
ncbi:hypothetical protein E2C01_076797 [Portunus trituberculatus]|uniref:Uncharacterized protein n=1 Tax=Portunus trituberculatus TaxID=210409 RepID=A0A5B7I9P1_PORTR|nr:hypothetical protein [Portunus trituberculatus]